MAEQYQALILAGLSRAFGVFLMRQFFSLLDPADLQTRPGSTEPGRLRSPAGRSAAGQARARGARDLHVPRSWNDFTWPLIANLEQWR